jgi:hypothetical protein
MHIREVLVGGADTDHLSQCVLLRLYVRHIPRRARKSVGLASRQGGCLSGAVVTLLEAGNRAVEKGGKHMHTCLPSSSW